MFPAVASRIDTPADKAYPKRYGDCKMISFISYTTNKYYYGSEPLEVPAL